MTASIHQERLLKVILKPHVSEKSSLTTEVNGQYVFRVLADATKVEVKKAVEHLFSVKVKTVRTLNTKSTEKRVGRIIGHTKAWKKAYVRLQAGQAINFGGQA